MPPLYSNSSTARSGTATRGSLEARRRSQGLAGQRSIRPVEQASMDVAGRKARSEPRRQRETSVAPQHQHLPAAQIVPHALQGQGALAADVQAGHALLQERALQVA